jgi:hypothetical protein
MTCNEAGLAVRASVVRHVKKRFRVIQPKHRDSGTLLPALMDLRQF